jgi:hypothetical protein
MATILFAWELGAGFDRLSRHWELAKRLATNGHRIVVIARDVARAGRVYGDGLAEILPAPIKPSAPDQAINPTVSYPQILHNAGYEDRAELRALVGASRSLLQSAKPDLAILDHSPTALLALRETGVQRILSGTGFVIFPDTCSLPGLLCGLYPDDQIRRHEEQVLGVINEVLENLGVAPLAQLGQLFSDVEETHLTTFRELDHYKGRAASAYWGITPGRSGRRPQWHSVDGPKIYAYLKPALAMSAVLGLLNQLRLPTLIYADGIDEACKGRYQSETLRFTEGPVDFDAVGRARVFCRSAARPVDDRHRWRRRLGEALSFSRRAGTRNTLSLGESGSGLVDGCINGFKTATFSD